jgi:hypothetical protein
VKCLVIFKDKWHGGGGGTKVKICKIIMEINLVFSKGKTSFKLDAICVQSQFDVIL